MADSMSLTAEIMMTITSSIQPLDLLEQFQAGLARHADVGHEQVDVAGGLEFFQGLKGVGRQLAFVAFVLQKIAQQFADILFVVGDQYLSLSHLCAE